MYCLCCTICAILFTILAICKFAFFASFFYGKCDINNTNNNIIEHEYDVIIMGAGISGISAAKQLLSKGINNILIIEAQDYVGGRIKTIEFNDDIREYPINIGASHLFATNTSHASSNINPILDILNKYNIKHEIETDTNPAYSTSHKHHLLTDHVQNHRKIQNLNELYGHQDLFISDKLGLNAVPLYLAGELIENGIEIVLNEPIQSIKHETNGIILETINDNNKDIKVNRYRAKYGINTFSFGVLKGNSVDFQPSLPPWKYESIFKHKMLKYVTIYIQWEMDFWSESQTTNSYNGKLFEIESRDFIISVYNLNDNKYFSGSNIWKINVIINNKHNHKKRSIEENIYEFVQNKLQQNYFENEYIPEPIDIFVTDWHENEFIKGINPVFYGSMNDIDHWRRIKSRVDRIFFAGDGVMDNEYYGTVTGGYLSGINTANDIIACLKSELNPLCPREYVEHDGDYFVEILRQFTDDYRFYFSWWIEFVVVRLMILFGFTLLIIRKIVKYVLKDSL